MLVKFSRPGVPELIPITFTRALINIPAVPYAMMLDGKIGYIPLLQFNESAKDEIESSVARLTKSGAKGIIIDLRGNPGGILDQSLSVSNLLPQEGQQISSNRARNGETGLSSPAMIRLLRRFRSCFSLMAEALQPRRSLPARSRIMIGR